MNRRTALRRFAISGAAAILLPACVRDSKQVSVALENLEISADDEELMAQLAQTLIPGTDKPGARAVNAHLFALVMVDDCLSPEKKEVFSRGLKAFDKSAPVPGGKTFTEAASEEKTETLRILSNDQTSGDVREFFDISRRYIIQGYTTSQYFMTEVKPHKLVPGPVYKGCVSLPQNLQS